MIEIPHPVNANHNGGQLQFLGDLLYFGTGDGGSGGDPPNNAQNTDSLLGKLLRIDPRPSGGQPYSVPADNPFVGKPGPRRDLQLRPAQPVPLLLRHGDAPQPRIAIGDVGQNRFEELDYTTVGGRRAAPTSAGTRFEGFAPYTRRKQRHPGPRRHDQADLRLQPQPRRRQLLDHRRLRGRATASCPPCAAATSTPTSASGELRSLVPHLRRRQRRPPPRPRGRLPHLLRRRRPRPHLRLLAGRRRCTASSRARRLLLADQPKGRGRELSGERHCETSTRRSTAPTGSNGATPNEIEVLNPANGSVSARSSRPAGDDRRHRRSRPRQPGRVGGDRDRGSLPLARQAARLDPRQRRADLRHDAGRNRKGSRRHRGRTVLRHRPDQLLRTNAAKFIGDEAVRPHSPLIASKKLTVQYRPHPVVGVISPWNFPLAMALATRSRPCRRAPRSSSSPPSSRR